MMSDGWDRLLDRADAEALTPWLVKPPAKEDEGSYYVDARTLEWAFRHRLSLSDMDLITEVDERGVLRVSMAYPTVDGDLVGEQDEDE